MTANPMNWTENNQRYLSAALAELRALLEQHARKQPGERPQAAYEEHAERLAKVRPASGLSEDDVAEHEPSSALEMLSKTFGLSSFESSIVLLCAGTELDSSFAGLCAAAQGEPARPYPTFSLSLAALPAPHWSALNPAAPLRRWRLIEVVNQSGAPLTASPLRIDERILHFLTGIQHLDERLTGLLTRVQVTEDLVPSHELLSRSIVTSWQGAQHSLPVIHLCGPDEASKRSIAGMACNEAGFQLYALSADHIPNNALELEGLLRLWEREAVLTSSALYIETETVDATDGKAVAQVARLLERIQGPVLLSTRDRWRPLRRRTKIIEVRKPTSEEQQEVWRKFLGEAAAFVNGQVGHLVAQFDLTVPAIRASVVEALEANHGSDDEGFASALWNAGRAQARVRLDDLAQRIEPVAQWDDLVLPADEKSMLREIASHVKHRATVYGAWGFGATSSRGLGINALFAGSSGTGKTMAAEVLANTLRLDLYRIDLSSVVSKYIGETEKNLRRVFDAAEDGGAILFFDEADALFGKRSEVKDSHDRYANIEINYLLQRMECYRGLAVLATNMRSALDPAFLRRIRFAVSFPFPEYAQRAEIWQRVFPRNTPTTQLNVHLLARLAVAGGNIRNIAMNAAFMAAEGGSPVSMSHLAQAARNEFAKMERPAPEVEIGGWA
ncbi:MAG TPA: ATP-binding protein [Candidatus Angelobacter sp.]|jgi:hypothetical protein|nr:ATP-binding protein [Candidatus Angelobacter sp.]